MIYCLERKRQLEVRLTKIISFAKLKSVSVTTDS